MAARPQGSLGGLLAIFFVVYECRRRTSHARRRTVVASAILGAAWYVQLAIHARTILEPAIYQPSIVFWLQVVGKIAFTGVCFGGIAVVCFRDGESGQMHEADR